MKKQLKQIVPLLALLVVTGLEARVMDDDEAKLADTSLLQTEANLFHNIRMGIALSFARCQGQTGCDPDVNPDEVKRLLNKLDSRIEDLTLRQESVEDPAEYDQVLALYVDERDNYSSILNQLGPIEEVVEEEIEEFAEEEELDLTEPELEETLVEEVPVIEEEPAEVVVEQEESFELFEDAESDLEDDEDLDQFEDDFDPGEF